MSDAYAASGLDRLPWLADEPQPARRRSGNALAAVAGAAILLVAGGAYWIGVNSGKQPVTDRHVVRPSTTVPLPRPREAEPPQPQVVFEPPPQVTSAPQPEVEIASPRPERRTEEPQRSPSPRHAERRVRSQGRAAAQVRPTARQSPRPAQAPAAPTEKPPTAWPAWQTQGAYGRIVRIGAFGSRVQAKLGWRYMVAAYPAVAHLQATVVETRNSRGRPFYRFQIGTTSQAHSEVLCQRMKVIHLSCAVVGLPWRPQGVER